MTKQRIFVAIDLSREVRTRVASYAKALEKEFRDVRVKWEHPDKYHITVKFAGSLVPDELNALIQLVETETANRPKFILRIGGSGSFQKQRSGVLWLGVQADLVPGAGHPYYDLFHGIYGDLGTESAPIKRKGYPHLTIARLKEPKRSRELIEKHLATNFEPIEFEVSELVIYESELQPAGSVYTVISRHPLGRLSTHF